MTFAAAPLTPQERNRMNGVTWHPGCPVALDDLRLLHIGFHGFDGRDAVGELVVHEDAVAAMRKAFQALWDAGFPVHRMRMIDEYNGDDFTSIEADNTSAFNCRKTTGSTTSWSQHAYGRAIDLNPLENPYVSNGKTSHPASVPFVTHRSGTGVITAGGPAVQAFTSAGWSWGGTWTNPKDLQHFSASGT
jgi:hypothetical protein